ncbi:MAG: Protein required for formate dehydrogenase activity [Candidatus Methanohalarchaeum thermophilum]|uniref:Protein required for formate dehydrogenase activity n=1 Tax=Methanohalarchaeum thermophilum TaxID=1903181 RepID=A0A1Q6DWC4_METT1|nr:MAG: Protein required for formate dehydrogenase activity [Candidatus Methanohalarchaeum thermophilum]
MWKQIKCLKDKEEPFIELPIEKPLRIYLNGRKLTTAMVSPTNEKSFVIGHLFSEGIISDYDDIESIRIDGKESSVLSEKASFRESEGLIVSGCGSGNAYNIDTPEVEPRLEINIKQISDAMIELLEKFKNESGGVHSAGLFSKEKKFLVRDIGRHNCIDKIIGMGVKNEIDFSQTFVVSTGRLSSDMVKKCANVGIPIAASHKSSTSLAVEIAQKSKISLIIDTGTNNYILTNFGQIKKNK